MIKDLAIQIKQFTYKGQKFVFFNPYRLEVNLENDVYSYDDSEFTLYEQAKSIDSLLESFYEDVATLWKVYVECDEDKLNDGARILREKLIKTVERIK